MPDPVPKWSSPSSYATPPALQNQFAYLPQKMVMDDNGLKNYIAYEVMRVRLSKIFLSKSLTQISNLYVLFSNQ